MDKIVGLVIFVVVSSGFFGLGLYILRHLDTATEFFEARGALLYGRRGASRMYRRSNIRIGALGFAVMGLILVIVGLTRLTITVVALVGSENARKPRTSRGPGRGGVAQSDVQRCHRDQKVPETQGFRDSPRCVRVRSS